MVSGYHIEWFSSIAKVIPCFQRPRDFQVLHPHPELLSAPIFSSLPMPRATMYTCVGYALQNWDVIHIVDLVDLLTYCD